MEKPPLAQTASQRKFWERLQPFNRPAASDTYKRNMSASSDLFADNFACYALAARKPLNEEDANGRLIMAGLEKLLYPWFLNPVTKDEVEEAAEFFTNHASVLKFPAKAWQAVLDNGGYFPLDIYSLPGGQTFLVKDGKHVPMISVEGPGALASHLEAHLETAFAPIIQATKARLFREVVGDRFGEFGLRSDQLINNHATLMMALYVGGGFTYTSDDQAVMLFPEYFKDMGTIGHEYIMAYQKKGRTLEEAQDMAYDVFVSQNERSALLPDVVDTMKSGLPAILRQIQKYRGTGKIIIPRFDSGNISAQDIAWARMLAAAEPSHNNSDHVVEDGFNPKKSKDVKGKYAAAGLNPNDVTVGAGGYFQEGTLRDTLSLVYKRSATMHEGGLEQSLKFSDSPGKESIPGQIRVYERGTTLIVAQDGEEIDGAMLMHKVVDNGRIVYAEDLRLQNQRANETWNKYDKIEYSPITQAIIDARTQEKQALQETVRQRK